MFLPHSPVLGGLGLYAASVGLLAQMYIFLYSFMDGGGTLANLPQLCSLLVSYVFAGAWLLLLGFLLSGGAMALTAIKAEQQASFTSETIPTLLVIVLLLPLLLVLLPARTTWRREV